MKRNCFFYAEDKDMNATIPYCDYVGIYKDWECEKCKHYISKSKVDEIVRQIVR